MTPSTNPVSDKKFVIVLGPHRSGTSLATSLVERLGADLALPTREASEENLRGFFEHQEVVACNERLLEFLGGRWDNPLFRGKEALQACPEQELETWLTEAASILERDFQGVEFAAVKDPRMCQLLPFWTEALRRSGFRLEDLYFLHVGRHPAVVAASQSKRLSRNPDFYGLGKTPEEGAALWYSLTRDVLQGLPSDRNLLVLYDDLIGDSAAQLERIARFLDLEKQEQELLDICREAVDSGLNRSPLVEEDVAAIRAALPEALSLFDRLAGLATEDHFSARQGATILQEVEQARTETRMRRIAVPYLSRLALERLQQRARAQFSEEDCVEAHRQREAAESQKAAMVHEHAEEMRQQHDLAQQREAEMSEAHREEVHRLNLEATAVAERFRRTFSWRITAPLRGIRTLQNRAKVRLSTAWLRWRGRARERFLALRQRSPRLADFLLTIIRPLFRLTDFLILRGRRSSTAMESNTGAASIAELKCTYVIEAREPGKQPLVTVVVPNYNHAPYLRQRLDSIYDQTYRNFEVILLDDCSSDDSRAILEEYRAKFPERTRTIFNETNSGSVFRQWQKAMDAAAGDLLWVAESDDWCSEDFLEELVPAFANEAVSLAYCRTDFMDQAGKRRIWTIEQFLADIDPDLWQGSFLMTARKLVAKAWAKKNILPNVSSAVFRNFRDMPLMQDEQWQGMRIAGDWVFYLHLIRGGMVAYSTNTVNYHRMHDANTSTATYSTDAYYREHEMVAKTVRRLYEVPDTVFKQQREIIRRHWLQNRDEFSEQELDRCYDLAAIQAEGRDRRPNLLMASFAFSAGGGETFPIQLANLFHKRGYAVTFLNCDQDRPEPGVRGMLNPEIPVVSNLAVLPEIIEDFGIDLIHSHHAWVDMSILDLLPEDARCSTVVSLHGMYETVPERRLRTILPRLLEHTGELVYTADKNLTSIKEHGLYTEGRFTKIGNALDVYPVTPVDLGEFGIPKDAFVLCMVSRAIPEKGWMEAVEAVANARTISGRDIHLILIGEGPEYDQLQKRESPDHLHLIGFRGNIRDFYAASDMGFLPSKFRGESFPLVVIDCLHAGTPMLASALGEVAQMLDADGTPAGHLFPLQDWEIPIDKLAQDIAHCATDADYMKTLRGKVAAAAEKFRPDIMCDHYDEVYVRLHRKRAEDGMC